MSAPKWAVCAIGLACVLLAGCETLMIRGGQTADGAGAVILLTELAGGRQVFFGSIEVTSQSLEKALRKLGLNVTVEQKDNVVRVRSQTHGGKKFSLVLTTAPDALTPDAGPHTHVTIEWDNSADGARGVQLFAELVLPHEAERAGAQK